MYEHHRQSIERLIELYRNEPGVVALLLGGSVAKGCERPDSDIDAMVILDAAAFAAHEETNRLCECISGYCTYEGGYFDVKYLSEDFLRAVARQGSEPARNAFVGARCLFSRNPDLEEVVRAIPVFQKGEQADKMLSFYSGYVLSAGYYWESADTLYLKTRTTADLIYFGLRLLLQENETLFPCHRRLFRAVAGLPLDCGEVLFAAEALLQEPTDAAKEAFEKALFARLQYQPPKDYSLVNSRFIDDNEQWWYKGRPNVYEW